MTSATETHATLTTGNPHLDSILGGGLPKGRIIEILGNAGVTELTYQLMAACQKAGGVASYFDAEHVLDVEAAHNAGVRLDQVLISQPDALGPALEIVGTVVRSKAVDLVIVDSLGALAKAKFDEYLNPEEAAEEHAIAMSRLLSHKLRALTAAASRTGTVVVFVNRDKLTPATTALRFYASVRLDVRRTPEGLVARTLKNKVAAPFQECAL